MPIVVQRLLALGGLIATAPIVGVVALLIALEDRRSPMFSHERVGRNGEPFVMRKLRTMRPGSPVVRTDEIDPDVITRVGAHIRRFKIDELPQLLNVVRGEMALVGPRPGLIDDDELRSAREALGVDQLLPGITGWAQIRDIDMSDPQRLAATDAEYLERRSWRTDVEILLATARGAGLSDQVRQAD